ncbi:MAG: hypothetical protein MI754_08770 [Chromatiales bacterium]|nr:hypothetical protein [Chromatiales bacterium]
MANLNGTDAAYVEDGSPGLVEPAVKTYHARFYLYVDSLQMDIADSVVIFSARAADLSPVFNLQLSQVDGQNIVSVEAFDDQGVAAPKQGVAVRPGWRSIELSWYAGIANDGSMNLYVDGVHERQISGLDNDVLSVGRVRLGSVAGNSATVTGRLDFDAFYSQRHDNIGIINKVCTTATDLVVTDATFLQGSSDCSASSSVQLGYRTTIDSGTTMNVFAPTVRLTDGASILAGANVRIRH